MNFSRFAAGLLGVGAVLCLSAAPSPAQNLEGIDAPPVLLPVPTAEEEKATPVPTLPGAAPAPAAEAAAAEVPAPVPGPVAVDAGGIAAPSAEQLAAPGATPPVEMPVVNSESAEIPAVT